MGDSRLYTDSARSPCERDVFAGTGGDVVYAYTPSVRADLVFVVESATEHAISVGTACESATWEQCVRPRRGTRVLELADVPAGQTLHVRVSAATRGHEGPFELRARERAVLANGAMCELLGQTNRCGEGRCVPLEGGGAECRAAGPELLTACPPAVTQAGPGIVQLNTSTVKRGSVPACHHATGGAVVVAYQVQGEVSDVVVETRSAGRHVVGLAAACGGDDVASCSPRGSATARAVSRGTTLHLQVTAWTPEDEGPLTLAIREVAVGGLDAPCTNSDASSRCGDGLTCVARSASGPPGQEPSAACGPNDQTTVLGGYVASIDTSGEGLPDALQGGIASPGPGPVNVRALFVDPQGRPLPHAAMDAERDGFLPRRTTPFVETVVPVPGSMPPEYTFTTGGMVIAGDPGAVVVVPEDGDGQLGAAVGVALVPFAFSHENEECQAVPCVLDRFCNGGAAPPTCVDVSALACEAPAELATEATGTISPTSLPMNHRCRAVGTLGAVPTSVHTYTVQGNHVSVEFAVTGNANLDLAVRAQCGDMSSEMACSRTPAGTGTPEKVHVPEARAGDVLTVLVFGEVQSPIDYTLSATERNLVLCGGQVCGGGQACVGNTCVASRVLQSVSAELDEDGVAGQPSNLRLRLQGRMLAQAADEFDVELLGADGEPLFTGYADATGHRATGAHRRGTLWLPAGASFDRTVTLKLGDFETAGALRSVRVLLTLKGVASGAPIIANVTIPRRGVGGACDDVSDCAPGLTCPGGSCVEGAAAECASAPLLGTQAVTATPVAAPIITSCGGNASTASLFRLHLDEEGVVDLRVGGNQPYTLSIQSGCGTEAVELACKSTTTGASSELAVALSAGDYVVTVAPSLPGVPVAPFSLGTRVRTVLREGDPCTAAAESAVCIPGTFCDVRLAQPACAVPRCGNGLRENLEQCDDGNTDDTDGCSQACEADCRITWEGTTVRLRPSCEALLLDGLAATTAVNIDIPTRGTLAVAAQWSDVLPTGVLLSLVPQGAPPPDCSTAAANCGVDQLTSRVRSAGVRTLYFTALEGGPLGNPSPMDAVSIRFSQWRCGNGVLEPGEQCDDGNAANDDTCSNACTEKPCASDADCDTGMSCGSGTCTRPCFITSQPFIPGRFEFSASCPRVVLVQTPFGEPEGYFGATVELAEGEGLRATLEDGLQGGCRASAYRPVVIEYETPDPGAARICAAAHPAVLACVAPRDDGTCSAAAVLAPRDGHYTALSFQSPRHPLPRPVLRLERTVAGCGNGFVEAGEDCDDGGAVDGDGCSVTCADECVVSVTEDSAPHGLGLVYPCALRAGATGETLQSPDDEDHYVVQAGEGDRVEVEVTRADGLPCAPADMLVADARSSSAQGALPGIACSAADPDRVACSDSGPQPGFPHVCAALSWHAAANDTFDIRVAGSSEGAYAVNVRLVPRVCGDGVLSPGEACDDGDTDDGDLCSSTCTVTTCTPEGPDSKASTPLEFVGPGNACFTLSDNSVDADFIRVRVRAGDQLTVRSLSEGACVLLATAEVGFLPDGAPGDPFEPPLDDLQHSCFGSSYPYLLCSRDAVNCGIRFLWEFTAAGDVLVRFRGYSGVTADWEVHVERPMPCGNGRVDPYEECDGAAPAMSTCSSACELTALDEIEPNSLPPTRGPTGQGGDFTTQVPQVIDSDALVRAALQPAGDEDVFIIHNPGTTPRFLTVETFTGVGTCSGDTKVFIRDASGNELASDDDGGLFPCSRLVGFPVQPGQFLYAHIINYFDNMEMPRYFASFTFRETP